MLVTIVVVVVVDVVVVPIVVNYPDLPDIFSFSALILRVNFPPVQQVHGSRSI